MLHPADVRGIDPGKGRPLAEKLDQGLESAAFALGDHLNSAVGAVADPAGQTQLECPLLGPPAEKYPLNPAFEEDMDARFHG